MQCMLTVTLQINEHENNKNNVHTLLAATTQRQTLTGTETYFWLIPLPAGSEKVNMELNNKTLLEYSPETQLMIQKVTAKVSKMRGEIQAWLSEESVP